ncbi:CoA transferase [Rhodococcus sp. AW25M09]|uniref:CoA transferase n=1 Tax=Rhodococcus sp. AW25M09 TaxID=1268303 RepID=UPI00034A8255|nr:CoA transferase [Rhodococcus sp. AW25M09]
MSAFLAATLPVATVAAESVAALGAEVGRLRRVLGLHPSADSDASTRAPTASMQRIAASFMGDSMLRIDDAPVQPFADLSGFFRVADGWVRTHANYPHHRAALLDAVGLDSDCGRDRFVDRLASMAAAELDRSCAENGALAVQVRTEDEWWAHPAGEAARFGPVIARTDAADSTNCRVPGFRGCTAAAPLAGIRVLDLTRVIAGPVATRALALFGAEVLRIDSPHRPEIAWQHLENGQGKRSASVDMNTRAGLARVHRLLDSADVLVTGYRPRALERFGLEHRAEAVHGRVSAWGTRGPWSGRRGFDSLVQAATGISILEGRAGELGRLPAQALDHASGYLLAAGIVSELADRADGFGSNASVEVSLARTAAWLLTLPGRDHGHGPAQTPPPDCVVTHGRVTAARPVFDEYVDYPFPARPWGTDDADWT